MTRAAARVAVGLLGIVLLPAGPGRPTCDGPDLLCQQVGLAIEALQERTRPGLCRRLGREAARRVADIHAGRNGIRATSGPPRFVPAGRSDTHDGAPRVAGWSYVRLGAGPMSAQVAHNEARALGGPDTLVARATCR